MTNAEPFAPEVLVIGEALIDIVEKGSWATEHVGGSPANVALGLGRRGVATALLTQVGDDPYGQVIIDHLSASHVHVLSQSITALPTSTAVAHIGADGKADYLFDVRWGSFEPPQTSARLIHTGSIAAFLEPGSTAVLKALEQADAAEITFDPNIRPALLSDHASALATFVRTASLATVVKLSDEDASWLYPHKGIDFTIDAVLEQGPRLVAITLGAEGAVIATPTQRIRVAAEAVHAVDTIGAGDTFMASLIHSVLRFGTSDLDRTKIVGIGTNAVHAAAITVSRAGADLPWTHELGRAQNHPLDDEPFSI